MPFRDLDEGDHTAFPYGCLSKTPPFVQSSPSSCEAACAWANVTSSDVCLDLGCGEGVFLIAAANKGSRAVGVDISPVLVGRSLGAADRAGVRHLVEARVLDFFEQSLELGELLGSATVVFGYLTPACWSDARIRKLIETFLNSWVATTPPIYVFSRVISTLTCPTLLVSS